MKILLLGKNGQVGWELQRSLAPLAELTALDVDSTGPFARRLQRPPSLAATVRAVRPDVIVNAAAHTAVDKAESEPELAHALNADAPAVLAGRPLPAAPCSSTTAPTTSSTAAAARRATRAPPPARSTSTAGPSSPARRRSARAAAGT